MELLIADDEENILELLRRALGGAHVAVTTAETAKEAAALLEKKRFDILLTDICMETPTAGIELARTVRKKFPKTDVLVMTGFGNIDHTINTLKLGAFDFILKPLDLYLVKFAIQRCQERRNLHHRIEMCVRASSTAAASLRALTERLEDQVYCRAVLEETAHNLEALKALDSPPKLEF